MKRLLAVLMVCSMLLLVEGCGKPKATGQEGGSRPGSRRELRDRHKVDKQQGAESKTAPAGETSGAAKQ